MLADCADLMAKEAGYPDCMLFTETWLHEHSDPPNLPGYETFNFARPANRQAQSVHRGGMTVYVKTSIAQHFDVAYVYPSRCSAILHINAALGLDSDMFLIVCYIAPHSGPGSRLLQNGDVWQVLEDRVICACQAGQVLVLGDLNARTGTAPDYPEWQLPEEEALNELQPTTTQRHSQDSAAVNTAGRQLLSLCCRTGLRIANGRTAGDVDGALTFHGPRVGSVVDYAICCPRVMSRAVSLSIENCEHSDHEALLLQVAIDIATAASNPSPKQPKPPKMRGARRLESWVSVVQSCGDELASITWSAQLAVSAAGQPSERQVEHLCGQFDSLMDSTWQTVARPVTRPERELQPAWYNRHLEGLRRAARAAKRHDPRSTRATTLQAQYKRELQRAKRRHKRQQQMSLVQMARNKRDMRPFWRAFKHETIALLTCQSRDVNARKGIGGVSSSISFVAAEGLRVEEDIGAIRGCAGT